MHAALILLLQAVTPACPPGDLAFGHLATGTALHGNPSVATDGIRPPDGMPWDAGSAVQLEGSRAMLTVDLGAPVPVQHLLLQGDDNDSYPIEGSLDGVVWRLVWRVPPRPVGHGLRTRFVKLPEAIIVRYLRVHGEGGDGLFSIGELNVYCETPSTWPPPIRELATSRRPSLRWWSPVALWRAIDNDSMVAIKGILAAIGTLVLAGGLLLERFRRPRPRLRDGLLAGCGLLAILSWWNLFHYHFANYTHIWEHYHYYVGAKYFRELGYTRLYTCTAAAEMELGYASLVASRPMRNLETNHLEKSSADIVRDPSACTRHFSQKRWTAFRGDIAYFRDRFMRTASFDYWTNSQRDHGFNGTPVWTIAGSLLANLGPASDTQVFVLGLLDPALLLLMWGFVIWGFGWRAAAVAALVWGTNFPARYWWNGGAYLRMDWLVTAVIAIALLRRTRYQAAGFVLTFSALLRIFPVFIFLGPVLQAALQMVRARSLRLPPPHRRFAFGALAALLVLMPLSAVVTGGFSSWVAFARNSEKHLSTPLTNNMGLKTVVAYELANRAQRTRNLSLDDPFDVWKKARQQAFARRKILFVLLVLAFVALLGRAVAREELWIAAVLGIGMIPVATELTCYYYSILLPFGLLWLRRQGYGIASCAMAAVTCMLAPGMATLLNRVGLFTGWEDDRCTWISVAVLIFVAAITASFAFLRQRSREEAAT